MKKYEIGDVWWVHFPYSDKNKAKHRPAIIIDSETIAILAMYVTSKNKSLPYSVAIEDWEQTGLSKPSWARIDKIVQISAWNMDQKIGTLSSNDLTKILQLVAEITTETFHEFSLIAIKNPNEKYLQKYDNNWDCWLFPYVRSTTNNKTNVDNYIHDTYHLPVTMTYVTHATHCKYSENDKVYKIYHHKLYEVSLDSVPDSMAQDEFQIGDTKFRWMSINELENDETIMNKNDEIIAFVKANCS